MLMPENGRKNSSYILPESRVENFLATVHTEHQIQMLPLAQRIRRIPKSSARLWYHELSRVFCDRLINKSDKDERFFRYAADDGHVDDTERGSLHRMTARETERGAGSITGQGPEFSSCVKGC